MDQVARRRRRRRNSTQNLTVLIGLLVFVLIVVVIVAVFVHNSEKNPDNTEPPQTGPGAELTITAPAETEFVTLEKTLLFQGRSDPAQSLTVNGTQVPREADGSFSYPFTLEPGINEITLSHKGRTVTYRVEYRYTVQSYAPSGDVSYSSGAAVRVEVFAREGSTLHVTLAGHEISMEKAEDQAVNGMAEGFARYTGTYQLPEGNTEDLILGAIEYSVTCDGITETYRSGTVVCRKMAPILASDPSVTPDYGDYIDVGSGYIVEIITYSAETFDGATDDDYSNPARNYLPEGTVDYCSQNVVTSNKLEYIRMRCGRRVYVKKNNYPASGKTQVVECYRGSLPDHNEIGFSSLTVSGNHTVLTLDTMWKAPFYFDLKPQEYSDPGNRDYRVTALTAEYVDITFCYATVFEGTVEVPADNPLFRSAELTRNKSDSTLRLYLKKTGAFYGWDAFYNAQGQLCFRFLNPVKATAASNAYGADLTGLRIMLDVGHGGLDGGSVATLSDGSEIDEAALNLKLAYVLKGKLESMGATVIMNRSDDSPLKVDDRIQYLKEQAPDLCIAIHQNAIKGYPNVNGCHVLYFTPFSQRAAKLFYEETRNSGVYQKILLETNVYYVARQTVCPVVLMENGFMTNASDLAGMMNNSVLEQKADAMAKAVARYFLNIDA